MNYPCNRQHLVISHTDRICGITRRMTHPADFVLGYINRQRTILKLMNTLVKVQLLKNGIREK